MGEPFNASTTGETRLRLEDSGVGNDFQIPCKEINSLYSKVGCVPQWETRNVAHTVRPIERQERQVDGDGETSAP